MHPLASKTKFDEQTRGFTENLLRVRGWKIHSIEHPVVDVEFTSLNRNGLRLRLICDNWDNDPPSIQLLSAAGDRLLSVKRDPAGVINDSRHPHTGYPFICMRGSREYHTHSSHVTDHWSNYRGKSSYDLGGILSQIWRAWMKT